MLWVAFYDNTIPFKYFPQMQFDNKIKFALSCMFLLIFVLGVNHALFLHVCVPCLTSGNRSFRALQFLCK